MASDLPAAREALRQLAVYVLGRRRHDVTGRFGLRPTPDGFGTPAFGGDQLEVIRAERSVPRRGARSGCRGRAGLDAPPGGRARRRRARPVVLGGRRHAGALGPRRPCSTSTTATARRLASWWGFGLTIIDEVEGTDAAITSATVAQLWPEHFDLGCAVERSGEHINLGASPGDSFSDDPYLYVGPWSAERPGDSAYWNAPFGATLTMSDLDALAPDDRRRTGQGLLRRRPVAVLSPDAHLGGIRVRAMRGLGATARRPR